MCGLDVYLRLNQRPFRAMMTTDHCPDTHQVVACEDVGFWCGACTEDIWEGAERLEKGRSHMKNTSTVEVKNSGAAGTMTAMISEAMRREFGEWMSANEDPVWRPVIELTKFNNAYMAKALLPGVSAEDIEVMVSPDFMLVKGEINSGQPGARKIFRPVKFPQPIDPKRVRAEIHNGVFSMRAEIAAASKVVDFMPKAA